MIEFKRGNLFECPVDALVNTVNTVGVMGKGIALQFSRAYPEIVQPYKDACKSGELTIGRVFTVKLPVLGGIDGPRFVINFPTKRHWKGNSRIEYIQSGLRALVEEISRLKIRSIAVPPLGCGLGGLSWAEVRAMVTALAGMDDTHVFVFEPAGKPAADQMKTATIKPKMTPGRASLLGLMHRYVIPLMDDSVSLLELHKLMYFMQESGEKLRLKYEKGSYGPYSTNLRHVLSHIEGHYVVGFGDASEEPGKVIEPLPGAFLEAESFLSKKPATNRRIDRVGQLIDGFETAYGMELLSSVHWVAMNEEARAKTIDEAVEQVHRWNKRKRDSFHPDHIKSAWDRMTDQGWLN